MRNDDLKKTAGVNFIPWEELSGANILVTGATGLVGFTLINVLLCANRKKNLGLSVLALVRDEKRARARFASIFSKSDGISHALKLIVGAVEELPEIAGSIDYIIHGASPTASRTFVEKPVDVIRTAVLGTDNVLRLAKEKKVRGLVYLSSMEMYGFPEKGHKVAECEAGALSPLNVRNCYPIAKQACEALCEAYAKQYGIFVMIARLTQIVGSDVNYDDRRVFAYFAECVKNKTDIILKTRAETERSYLSASDCATAILTILLKGKIGEAYNCADESTYSSVAEMAEKIAAAGGVSVRYEIDDGAGFPETIYMDLDCSRLRALGWKPVGRMEFGE